MNSKKLIKFTSFVSLLTLVAAALVADTYAKYTTTVSGSDTAIVAKWDVSDGDALANFDIFDVSKIYDTNGVTDYTAAGTSDTDVKTGTTNGIIAPGTWGKFSYTLSNDSEVTVAYAVDYTVDEKGVYLQWSTDGTTWTDDLADVTATKIDIDSDKEITVYWKWAYEAETTPVAAGQTDAADTTLGEATTAAQPTITVDVTFTQVD